MLDNAIQTCPDSVCTVRDGAHFGSWHFTYSSSSTCISPRGECQFHPPPPFGLSELEVEVVVPEPYRLPKSAYSFQVTKERKQTNVITLLGFPDGKEGDVVVKAWLEENKSPVTDIAIYTIKFLHKEHDLVNSAVPS